MESFTDWLNAELRDRGWSRSEAARRGNFSASMLDKVINGYAKPGIAFCRGISLAFGIPLEDIMRKAGILPPLPDNDTIRQVQAQLGHLDKDDLQTVLELVRALRESSAARKRGA